MPAEPVAGEWLMIYSGKLSERKLSEADRARVIEHFASLVAAHGPERAIGVVSGDDVLVAIGRRHNYTAREHARSLFGEDRWQLCKLAGLKVGNRVHTDARRPSMSPERTQLPTSRPLQTSDAPSSQIRPRTARERVTSFLRAVTGPRVEEAEYQRRLAICRSNRCGHLKTDGDRLFCGACGCPKWRMAELHTKLRLAHLACPAEPPMW